MQDIQLNLLGQTFAVHRLDPDAEIPPVLSNYPFVTITRTDEELSIIAPEDAQVASERCDAGWVCFKVAGPLDFGLIGVLAGIANSLANAQVSIFALSTFDTDYILVKREQVDTARNALKSAGYILTS